MAGPLAPAPGREGAGAAPGGPAHAVILCLNPGWGGTSWLREATRWVARAGRPLAVAYVVGHDPRRSELRRAARALRRARALAADAGVVAGETVIRARSEVEGLDLAARAFRGGVGLGAGQRDLTALLRRSGVPVVTVAS